jgi:hypothetical protein
MPKNISQLILLCSFGILVTICACTNDKYEFKKLENYYTKNKGLHQEMHDSLTAFCRRNHTEVKLRRYQFKERAIVYYISFPSRNAFTPIFFDSSLLRHDEYPETKKYIVPAGIIENFSKSIYLAVRADSTGIFCAGKWEEKLQIGTHGDSQYGIFLSAGSNLTNKCENRLDNMACLTKSSAY